MVKDKSKPKKPVYIDRQNSGPMLTNKQYKKIKKLESAKNNGNKNI